MSHRSQTMAADPLRNGALSLQAALAGEADAHPDLKRLLGLLGRETTQQRVTLTLGRLTASLGAAVTGAVHLTCADELEAEAAEVFRNGFAAEQTPRFANTPPAPFRLATLGGHYQWGAIQIAEDHYAQERSAAPNAFKLMVLKINAHVGVEQDADGRVRFGFFQREDRPTTCCGALSALLGGRRGPFLDHLRRSFLWEGRDRLAALLDEDRVRPEERMLRAAVASARLQARMAAIDIQESRPASPTLYLVPVCVSLNRQQYDRELLCGLYVIDRRDGAEGHYYGFGDDPEAYTIDATGERVLVSAPELSGVMTIPDHRELVLEEWRGQGNEPREAALRARMRARLGQGMAEPAGDPRAQLAGLVALLGTDDPVAAAVLLFARGVTPVYHVQRAHQLALGVDGPYEASLTLDGVHEQIADLSPEKAAAVVSWLTRAGD